jgi:hypothetical protein
MGASPGEEIPTAMCKNGGDNPAGVEVLASASGSVALAAVGVRTGEDFARLMSALMSDVITGDVTPEIANAACNAGGKLLKVVEMQYKYGSKADDRATRPFLLVGRQAEEDKKAPSAPATAAPGA